MENYENLKDFMVKFKDGTKMYTRAYTGEQASDYCTFVKPVESCRQINLRDKITCEPQLSELKKVVLDINSSTITLPKAWVIQLIERIESFEKLFIKPEVEDNLFD